MTAKEQGKRLLKYITKERKDVLNIYFYAILSGLVQLSLPLGIQAIISFAMGATMVTSIYILIAFVVLGTWLVGFFRVKVMEIIEKIQQKIFVEYAISFSETLPKIKLEKTNQYYLPELINRFFDTQNLQKGISKILLEIPTAIIHILFGIILLSFYHPWFLAFGGIVLVGVVLIFNYTSEKGIETSLIESDKKYFVASWLEDIASSVKSFKTNKHTNLHLRETDDRLLDYLSYRTHHFKVLLFQYKTIIFFKVLITLVMLVIGTYLLVNQKLNIGAFIAAEIVVLIILTAVEKLIKSLESYYDVITALTKLSKVTDLPLENETSDIIHIKDDIQSIEFKNVSFGFGDEDILKNLNFKVQPSSINVISGELSSGKSLLINLMSGIYAPTSGHILYNDVSSKNLTQDQIRRGISIHTDDIDVFKGTVLENIQLGNEKITVEKINHIAQKIGIDDFGTKFTNGFLTKIQDGNSQLSYSNKKIILLLRALATDNKIIILEDPYDGLSKEIKEKMIAFLQELAKEKTIIVVTQDDDFIQKAHQHFHMINGLLETKK